MTGWASRFTASNPATLMLTNLAVGENAVHEPVVKSCRRVPTEMTTSASAASALADVHPVTPIGPALSGWAASIDALPATVSTTGMLWISANRVSSASAPR